MNEPLWLEIPTDEEILLARRVLKRMSHVIPTEDGLWGDLVEARRILTISVDYLSRWPGHRRHYQRLWRQMLNQD